MNFPFKSDQNPFNLTELIFHQPKKNTCSIVELHIVSEKAECIV